MEMALVVITSYLFFAIGEGGFFGFEWSFADLSNALFTLWMAASNWYLFKKLNKFLYKNDLGRPPLSIIVHGIISVFLLGLYSTFFNWFYIEIIWHEHLSETFFFGLILPLALLTFVIWTIGFFLLEKYRHTGNPLVDKEQNPINELKKQLISKVGKKSHIVPIKNIAFISTDGGYVYACTFSGKSFLIDECLNTLEKQMDKRSFFRVNRQMILARRAILNYTPEINQKIKIGFLKVDGFDNMAMISRYRSPKFKTWLKS